MQKRSNAARGRGILYHNSECVLLVAEESETTAARSLGSGTDEALVDCPISALPLLMLLNRLARQQDLSSNAHGPQLWLIRLSRATHARKTTV